MADILVNFFFAFFESAILFITIYNLFPCKFNDIKKKIVIIIAVATQAIFGLISSAMSIPIKNIIFCSVAYILLSVLFSGKAYIKTFFIILMIYEYLICDIITANLFALVTNTNIETMLSSDVKFLFYISSKIANIILTIFIINFFKNISFDIPKKYWIELNVITATFLIIVEAFMSINSSIQDNRISSVIISIISSCFLLMSFLVIYFFGEMCMFYQEQKQNYILNMKNQALEFQLVYQEETTNNFKKIKHDINKNLVNISYLLKQNNIAESISYIAEITSTLETTACNINTGNSVIDAILNYKTAICKNYNIKFEIQADSMPVLKISSTDINAIITNLIDNAIDANLKLNTANRYINVKLFSYKNYLTFVIKNPHCNTFRYENDFIKTTKDDIENHGYGLKSIKSSTEKYSGTFKFINEDNVFIATVMIPIDQNQ